MKRFLPVLIFITLAAVQSPADRVLSPEELPFYDNTDTRISMKDIIFASSHEAMSAPQLVFDAEKNGPRVMFRTEKQQDAFYLLFLNEEDYKFPVYSAGSYVIKRNQGDGKFVQVKIFFRSDPDCFVRVFPFGDRSRMDVYLYGFPVYRNINLPFTFEAALTKPFSTIADVTAKAVAWNYLFPAQDAGYSLAREFSASLRGLLSTLRDADDGAMDEDGGFVYIETDKPMEEPGFNCSGFAKWVVDSFYKPLTGRLIALSLLKEKHEELRGNRWSERHEDDRDPYFGLDWNRNLAAVLEETRHNRPVSDPEHFDLRSLPFFSYMEDVGYAVKDLKPVLYLAALLKPGYMFLGSVNSRYGSGPSLQQHFHVAVFIPYLNEDGSFQADVYERSVSSSVEALVSRYPHDFIHLVALPITGEFSFPECGQ